MSSELVNALLRKSNSPFDSRTVFVFRSENLIQLARESLSAYSYFVVEDDEETIDRVRGRTFSAAVFVGYDIDEIAESTIYRKLIFACMAGSSSRTLIATRDFETFTGHIKFKLPA